MEASLDKSKLRHLVDSENKLNLLGPTFSDMRMFNLGLTFI